MPELELSAGTVDLPAKRAEVDYRDARRLANHGATSPGEPNGAGKGREPVGMVRMDTFSRRFAREGSL
jgi:hypothetical protein